MELHQFFIFLAIILIAARLLSETVARFGIPSVIGELLAGLLIGPSLLGWVTPDTTMKLLAEIGIIPASGYGYQPQPSGALRQQACTSCCSWCSHLSSPSLLR